MPPPSTTAVDGGPDLQPAGSARGRSSGRDNMFATSGVIAASAMTITKPHAMVGQVRCR